MTIPQAMWNGYAAPELYFTFPALPYQGLGHRVVGAYPLWRPQSLTPIIITPQAGMRTQLLKTTLHQLNAALRIQRGTARGPFTGAVQTSV